MTATPQLSYSSSEARQNFKQVLDAAENDFLVSVRRGSAHTALVSAPHLRRYLELTCPAHARTVLEDNGYVIFMEGLPFAAEGSTLQEALDDLIVVLREYAADWGARLRLAPNHADRWGLVQLINLSSDQELIDWLKAEATGSRRRGE
ncbi:hypothetical protein [Kocuria sp.]|uniref:hypothetical protein n=1 Tax=Kocuria sp. TaxID=1871328 RepID=UPI0026DF772E|nr:hypothetical protein [Kocuria sp.]MDO5618094.1 hypothetical protein [Kocuria sp.]